MSDSSVKREKLHESPPVPASPSAADIHAQKTQLEAQGLLPVHAASTPATPAATTHARTHSAAHRRCFGASGWQGLLCAVALGFTCALFLLSSALMQPAWDVHAIHSNGMRTADTDCSPNHAEGRQLLSPHSLPTPAAPPPPPPPACLPASPCNCPVCPPPRPPPPCPRPVCPPPPPAADPPPPVVVPPPPPVPPSPRRFICDWRSVAYMSPSACSVYAPSDPLDSDSDDAHTRAGVVLTWPEWPVNVPSETLLPSYQRVVRGAVFRVWHHYSTDGGWVRVIHENCRLQNRTLVSADAGVRDTMDLEFGPALFEARLVGPELIWSVLQHESDAPHPCTYLFNYTAAVSISGAYELWLHWQYSDYLGLQEKPAVWPIAQWAPLVQALPRHIDAHPHAHARGLQPPRSVAQQLEQDSLPLSAHILRIRAPSHTGRYVHHTHPWSARGLAWWPLPIDPIGPLYGCHIANPNHYVFVPYARTADWSQKQRDQWSDTVAATRSLQTQLPSDPLSWSHVDRCFGQEQLTLYLVGDSQARQLSTAVAHVLLGADSSFQVQKTQMLWRPPSKVMRAGEALPSKLFAAQQGALECYNRSSVPPATAAASAGRRSSLSEMCFQAQPYIALQSNLHGLLRGDLMLVSHGQHASSFWPPRSPEAMAQHIRHELTAINSSTIEAAHRDTLNAQLRQWQARFTASASATAAAAAVSSDLFAPYVSGDSWLRVAQRKLIWWSTQTFPYATADVYLDRQDGRTLARLQLYDEVLRRVLTEFGIHQVHYTHEISAPFRDCAGDQAHIEQRLVQQLMAAIYSKMAERRGCEL